MHTKQMTYSMIEIPKRFERKLNEDKSNELLLKSSLVKFDQILTENNLYFFEEYTDHGFRHINSVLKAADDLIEKNTFSLLNSNDILILINAICLHDLGMHLQLFHFRDLVLNNFTIACKYLDKDSWPDLWNEYLGEIKKYSSRKRLALLGEDEIIINIPDLNNINNLTNVDKKIIGEFIRKHHPRIAHEIAINGINTEKGRIYFFDSNSKVNDLSGLLARSHGMNIRDTFNYFEIKYNNNVWKEEFETNIVYLMVILRMADYFQIDSNRILKIPFQTKTFKSPLSYKEHQKHLQINKIVQLKSDNETLYIEVEPTECQYFLAFTSLFKNIQEELDTSWAILGEVYGKNSYGKIQHKISFRRIRTNLDNVEEFSKRINYIPKNIRYTIDYDIPKLLISPLYGDNPSYGIRELIQNSVDACLLREKIDDNYIPEIIVELYLKNNEYYFSITDNGIGMSINEISDYFLKIGSTFRKSTFWRENFIDKTNKSSVRRSGKFGIGVLAAYLLGNKIEVETKSFRELNGYKFETTLEQEQIEIIKTNKINVGTKICIKISKSIYTNLFTPEKRYGKHQLIDYFNLDYQIYVPKFFNWYCLDHPSIKYLINGKQLKKKITITNDEFEKWFKIQSDYFNDIRWNYNNYFPKGHGFNKGGTIICNGIIIPSLYSFQNKLIRNIPTISIYDNNAHLPLSLNRNTLLEKLDCEDAIIEDIYKHIIYTLVTFSTKTRLENDSLVIFPIEKMEHHALDNVNILYSINGYTINIDEFINKIYDIQIVDCLIKATYFEDEKALHNKRFKIRKNQLIRFDTMNNLIGYPNIKSGVFHKKNEELFTIIKKRSQLPKPELRLAALEKHKQKLLQNKEYRKMIKKGYLTFNEDFEQPIRYTNQNDDLIIVEDKNEELIELYHSLDFFAIFCCEFEYTLNKKNTDPKLLSLIKYYLNDDPIIPYRMEERKKKYPKVFSELKRFNTN